MKIMDLSGENGDCQAEMVINSNNKKSKQSRLPFQTLSTDSSSINKKRKSPASPDCRTHKQPKVNTKENSLDVSEKIESKETIQNEIDIVTEEINTGESEDMKDDLNKIENETNKKSTPAKGIVKVKKSEIKNKMNSLTKFFTKIDNKEKNIKVQSNSKNIDENSEETNNVDNKLQKISEKSKDCEEQNIIDHKNSDVESNCIRSNDFYKMKEDNEDFDKSKEATVDDDKMDIECKKRIESKDAKVKHILNSKNKRLDKSSSVEDEYMDVDSDVNLLSNDSNDDNDNDSCKSDTDSKKTEHEDTDSKDEKVMGALKATPKRSTIQNCSVTLKKLTPKQIEKKMEIQKKRESRERQRLEKERKLQEERENKKKEKEEKKREREEKEKLLKEQKKKDKELRELKKQAEIEQKQKEKEAKEEDRRKREEAKEEEKRRKEEEKLEAERKKLKAASTFVSFFVPKKPSETKPVEEENKIERKNFMPFEIKADMRVAPIVRRNLTHDEKKKLDEVIETSDMKKNELYINGLKIKKFDVRKSERTWPFEANDDIVILDENDESSNIIQPSNTVVKKHRAKLFLFEENRRPPYWGTWRKSSKSINSRRPFAMDTNWFDYEVDSDDEWEEEEPGESLHGSDDEKEKDEENAEENEYDVDNDFMVPHGYLSEEEIGADEEDDDDMNPENQQKKLKILGEQFEAERNTKTKQLKPKVIGCVWLNKDNAYPKNTPAHAIQFLTARHIWVNEVPLILTPPADTENLNDNENGTPSSKNNVASTIRKAKALEEAIPDLIRLFHGNTHGRGFLLQEFLEFWSKKKEGEGKWISKSKLQQKLRDIATWIACPESGPMHEKFCWYVAEEYRIKYLPEEKVELPNQWEYSLTPKRRKVEMTDKPDEKEKEKEKKNVPRITQFTKMLAPDEKQNQLAEKLSVPVLKLCEKPPSGGSTSKTTPLSNKPPKRALLISVPRGEPLLKSPRISLLDKFITKTEASERKNSKEANKLKEDLDDDDCRVIDNSDEQIDIISVSTDDAIDDNNKSAELFHVEIENNENDSDQLLNESKSSDVDVTTI